MGDLEKALPFEIVERAAPCCSELGFLLGDAIYAIDVASEKRIAVLGVEMFTVIGDSFYAEGCTVYDLDLRRASMSSWDGYVAANNDAALQMLSRGKVSSNYHYILTSTSEDEWKSMDAIVESNCLSSR